MELFYGKTEKLVSLRNVYDLDISIDFVVIIEKKEPPAMHFDLDFIKFAYEIGARIDIDAYVN